MATPIRLQRSQVEDFHQETFLSRAQRLDTAGHSASALDLIYDTTDELMRSGEFGQLDSILANIRVADLSVDILLGVLTATLPARSRLPARAKLHKEIENVLKVRGEYEEGLLTGLALAKLDKMDTVALVLTRQGTSSA